MRHTAILMAMALYGCESGQTSMPQGVEVSQGNSAGLIQLVTLSDGTKCAALVGAYKAGLSCAWGCKP